MTEQRLENIAKFHVERFATTATHLKRVLLHRMERAVRSHGGEAGALVASIDAIVARFERTGVVDDARYAAGRAVALRRLGKSPGKIRALLIAKGVDRAVIETALNATAITESGNDAALEAALAYAQRRRLGPFGKHEGDAEMRRKKATKDLGALARAGFSYAIAKRVLSGGAED